MQINVSITGNVSVASLPDGGPLYHAATPEEAIGRLLLANGNWRRAGLTVSLSYGQHSTRRAYESINADFSPVSVPSAAGEVA